MKRVWLIVFCLFLLGCQGIHPDIPIYGKEVCGDDRCDFAETVFTCPEDCALKINVLSLDMTRIPSLQNISEIVGQEIPFDYPGLDITIPLDVPVHVYLFDIESEQISRISSGSNSYLINIMSNSILWIERDLSRSLRNEYQFVIFDPVTSISQNINSTNVKGQLQFAGNNIDLVDNNFYIISKGNNHDSIKRFNLETKELEDYIIADYILSLHATKDYVVFSGFISEDSSKSSQPIVIIE